MCYWMGWFSDSNIVYHGYLGSYKVYWLKGICRKELMIIDLVVDDNQFCWLISALDSVGDSTSSNDINKLEYRRGIYTSLYR